MPDDIKNELESQEVETKEVSTKEEETPVNLTPAIDQEKMAAFEAWQKQQALNERKETMLKPLGGEEGYKATVAKIQAAGHIDFLKQVEEDLKVADRQAMGIAKLQAFSAAMGSAAPKKEEPMFDSLLPSMGSSTATAASKSAEAKVNIGERVTYDGVQDAAVKEALESMNKSIQEHNLKNPNSYKDQHLVGLKALNDAFGPVIKTAEAFKNYDRAHEAMNAYKQAFSSLASLGLENGDKTLVDLFENAKHVTYQADLVEKTLKSDQGARVSYKDSMFTRKY